MSCTMRFSALMAFSLLAGCATQPTGPSQLVLPGTGMGFPQFQGDDYFCRQYAYAQIGGVSPNQATMTSGAASAALGAALGAAAGAAIGVAKARRLARAQACWAARWWEPRPPAPPATKPSSAMT